MKCLKTIAALVCVFGAGYHYATKKHEEKFLEYKPKEKPQKEAFLCFFEKVSEANKTLEEQDYKDIILPKRATKNSAGYDFFAPFDIELKPGQNIKFMTDIKVKLPEDKFLMLVPRSGLGFKHRLQLDNTVGVIDADYYNNVNNEGNIGFSLTYNKPAKGNEVIKIAKGTAFAQGIIMQYHKTSDDCVETVREGGFGSTTKIEVASK